MKSLQLLSFLSLSWALVEASSFRTFRKRQAVNCPPGFRNNVFNTGMSSQGDVSNRWATLSSHQVSNWIGFTINPLSASPSYGSPAVSSAVDSAQIRIAMDRGDIQTAKNLITSPSPPKYLELFNEPDYSYMSFTALTQAPEAANSLQDIIDTPTSTQFISPAPAFTASNYLADFFARCVGCLEKINIIALHVYSKDPGQAIQQITDVHNKYPGKRLWITELAPASSPDQGCTLDENGVISWMQTVVRWAASSGYVDRVFWNCGEWGAIYKDNVGMCNPSLTNADGSATPLLKAYSEICIGSGSPSWNSTARR